MAVLVTAVLFGLLALASSNRQGSVKQSHAQMLAPSMAAAEKDEVRYPVGFPAGSRLERAGNTPFALLLVYEKSQEVVLDCCDRFGRASNSRVCDLQMEGK